MCYFPTLPPPPQSTLFPYTTLFRSSDYHARDNVSDVALALDEHGRFLALRVATLANLGAYLSANGTLVPLNNIRSEEHTSELQSQSNLVCRLLLEKKKNTTEEPNT